MFKGLETVLTHVHCAIPSLLIFIGEIREFVNTNGELTLIRRSTVSRSVLQLVCSFKTFHTDLRT